MNAHTPIWHPVKPSIALPTLGTILKGWRIIGSKPGAVLLIAAHQRGMQRAEPLIVILDSLIRYARAHAGFTEADL